MLSRMKSRKTAAVLAFAGAVGPVSGLHKFYLGQPIWGVIYLLLSLIPFFSPVKVASALEGIWYLAQNEEEFNENFNAGHYPFTVTVEPEVSGVSPDQISAIAQAVRELDQLRQEGLISEYEFEQKRRQLLDRIA
jgi:TM2 domain-containing membrane protein YozV